ncbi:MAG: co-chaperone GroES family protein [Saprospiraceae bacterium]
MKDTDTGKIIVIGDRVLIKPTTPAEKTEGGLYLPQGMHKTEELRTGYVIKVGPGYPIPTPPDDEPWKEPADEVKYVPLQPKPGDLAVYIQKNVFQIRFNGDEYVIAPHGAILMVVREEE